MSGTSLTGFEGVDAPATWPVSHMFLREDIPPAPTTCSCDTKGHDIVARCPSLTKGEGRPKKMLAVHDNGRFNGTGSALQRHAVNGSHRIASFMREVRLLIVRSSDEMHM